DNPPKPLVTGLKDARSVTIGPDGRIYVTAKRVFRNKSDRVVMVIENGKAKPFATGFDYPNGESRQPPNTSSPCTLLIKPATKETIANVVIEPNGGKILRAGKADEVAVPAGAKVIDFSDKYVIPGTDRQSQHPR